MVIRGVTWIDNYGGEYSYIRSLSFKFLLKNIVLGRFFFQIEPDKMVFYTGHNSCQIFPKGDPGRSYMISTKTEDDKLTELVNILITIRTGEAKGPKV